MALEDVDRIDLVLKNPNTDGFDLILVDGGGIADESRRYNLMIAKLGAYVQFVLSGQIYENYPEAKGKPIRFCVVCQSPPNEAMLKVQGIRPRNAPGTNLPVVFQMAGSYLDGIADQSIEERP